MDNKIIDKILNAFEEDNNEELSILIINSIRDNRILEKANGYKNKFEFFNKNKALLLNYWCNDLTEENIENILSKLNEKNIGIVKELSHILSNEKYINEIIKIGKKRPNVALEIWKNVSIDTLSTALERNENEVIKILELDLDKISRVWNYLSKDSQSKLIDKVLINNKNKRKVIKKVWKETDKELQQEKVIDIAKNNPELLLIFWEDTDYNIQITNLEEVLKAVKTSNDLVEDIWFSTCKEAKEKNIENVIDLAKSDSALLEEIWNDLNSKIRLANFENVCSKLKQYNLEEYKSFIYKYIGEVELDKNNDPIIPEDLKNIIFNNKFLDQYYKNSSKLLNNLESNLPDIINKWEDIKRNIQYKKANSKINDNIEIRTNIESIVNAYKAIEIIIPKTLPEIEFCNIPGAEDVGIITKYTSNPETARKRAFDIANRMEMAEKLKKYPDFSVNYNNIELKVYGPNDKRAMLMGYNTDCCFRPNGNADNFGDDRYSLYQYCLTTPYGGVLECGKKDLNDMTFSEVYMGTPFLVNGNCMAFHSYETDNGKESETVNRLIVEAAKKAIEHSNGNLNVVVITNLHTGRGSLDINDKFNLGTFFEIYTDDEYIEYMQLRKSLSKPNYILAARVEDRILTKEELNKFCIETCNGDIEVIKQKLNLKFGKIEQNYDIYKNDAVVYKKEIKNSKLVRKFSNEYDKLKNEREILSLINYKIKLEKKKIDNGLTIEESKILQDCNETINKLNEEGILEYSNLNQNEIKKRLKENLEKLFEIYCGNNLKLIANCYGICDDKFESLIKEKAEKRAEQELSINKPKEKDKRKQTEIGRQKKEKSKLISEIKRKGNLKLNQLISKVQKNTLTRKDLLKLEEAGISTKNYKESIETTSYRSDVEYRKRVKFEQRVRRYIKDDEFIKTALISEIIKEPSEEMIKKEARRKTILTARNNLSEKITETIKQNRNDKEERDLELEPDEIQKRDNEIRDRILNLDNILSCISSEREINESEKELMDNLNYIYGIDIKKIYNEIMKEKDKLSNDIMRKQFDKIQSSITIGIEGEKSINYVIKLISGVETQKSKYYNLIYGKNWYVATDKNKDVDVYIRNNIDQYEEMNMKDVLEKMIESETNEVIRERLKLKYDELFCISMDSIDNCTEDISIMEKNSEINKIKHDIEYEKDENEK